MRKNFFVFLVAHLCLVVLPLSAYADKCDDMKNKASSTFDKAGSANAQGNYARCQIAGNGKIMTDNPLCAMNLYCDESRHTL